MISSDKPTLDRFNVLLASKPAHEEIFEALLKVEGVLRAAARTRGQFMHLFDRSPRSNPIDITRRDELERQLARICFGTQVSISDLLNELIYNINNSDLCNTNIESLLQRFQIKHKMEDGNIIYPDKNSSKRKALKRDARQTLSPEGQNNSNLKFLLLLEVLIENRVYADDLFVVPGERYVEDDEYNRYIYIDIPRINRTVFLSTTEGKASFVILGHVPISAVQSGKLTRNGLTRNYGAKQIKFNADDHKKWKNDMAVALFGSGKKQQQRLSKSRFPKVDLDCVRNAREAYLSRYKTGKKFMSPEVDISEGVKVCDDLNTDQVARTVFGMQGAHPKQG